jgi:sugar phosphate isomerase/epimerase
VERWTLAALGLTIETLRRLAAIITLLGPSPMKLGFVSAILADLGLEEVFRFAAETGFTCVELMCWPPGKAERRYAGVTHFDVTDLAPTALDRVRELVDTYGVAISGLGYYPNPLSANREEAEVAVAHLRKVIEAAAALGVGIVNSFVGRDPSQSVDANWPRFLETWRPLVRLAEERGVRIGIENCPMLFTADEWPGGKNLATTPALWRRMFADIPSTHFGLNFDPSHFIWQQIDYLAPLAEFRDRLVHIHAKDARVDLASLNEHGVLAYPKLWHTPKVPGQGDVRWGAFLGALADAGYTGPVAIEIEDRAFEGSLEARKDSLRISGRYLRQFVAG